MGFIMEATLHLMVEQLREMKSAVNAGLEELKIEMNAGQEELKMEMNTVSRTGPPICNVLVGSISQWNFIALKFQYTTVNYSQQLF
jgi:hypothetical protein